MQLDVADMPEVEKKSELERRCTVVARLPFMMTHNKVPLKPPRWLAQLPPA